MRFFKSHQRRRYAGPKPNLSLRARAQRTRGQQRRAAAPRRRTRLRKMVRTGLVLASLGLALWGSVAGFRELRPHAAQWFEIRDITVTGTSQISQLEVIERMELRPHETLVSLDKHAVIGRVTAHPWIKEATVRRIPMHTVAVHVTERRPVAVLKTPSRNFLLDEEGSILSEVDQQAQLPLPTLVGIDPERLMRGDAQSRRAARAGILVASLMEEVFDSRLEVQAGDPLNVIASVAGLRFVFGEAAFEEKWGLYRRIRPAILSASGSVNAPAWEEIDLRYPDKIIVRERG